MSSKSIDARTPRAGPCGPRRGTVSAAPMAAAHRSSAHTRPHRSWPRSRAENRGRTRVRAPGQARPSAAAAQAAASAPPTATRLPKQRRGSRRTTPRLPPATRAQDPGRTDERWSPPSVIAYEPRPRHPTESKLHSRQTTHQPDPGAARAQAPRLTRRYTRITAHELRGTVKRLQFPKRKRDQELKSAGRESNGPSGEGSGRGVEIPAELGDPRHCSPRHGELHRVSTRGKGRDSGSLPALPGPAPVLAALEVHDLALPGDEEPRPR